MKYVVFMYRTIKIWFQTDLGRENSATCLKAQEAGLKHKLRACLHGGGGPQVGEVTRLGGVTRLSI